MKGVSMPTLARFFGPVEGSIKGLLNFEELYRSFLASLGSGSAVAVLLFLSRTILGRFAEILPDTSTASLVTVILSLVFDMLRRLTHGIDLSPTLVLTPTPIPAPAPIPAGPLPAPAPVVPAT